MSSLVGRSRSSLIGGGRSGSGLICGSRSSLVGGSRSRSGSSLIGGSRSSLVSGGGLVGGGGGGGLVSGSLGVLGLSFVADLSHVASISVNAVGNPLEPAVGEGDVVGAAGRVALPPLVLAVVGVGVVVPM